MDSSSSGIAVVDSVEESGNGRLSPDEGPAEVCGVDVVVVFRLERPDHCVCSWTVVYVEQTILSPRVG